MQQQNVTAFGLYGAAVDDDGSITFPGVAFPEELTNTEDRRVKLLSIHMGVCNCNSCGLWLEFPVFPGIKITLPWRPGGWFIGWNSARTGFVVLCHRCLKEG